MTEEQVISPFDALTDEAALKLIHRIYQDRFGSDDGASEAMDEATKSACWIIAKQKEDVADELMARVFDRPVKWWKDAA